MRELDHVFVFLSRVEAEEGGRAAAALGGLGLVPSYRRRHHGQGTANVCYLFDDAYLELLFVVDEDELALPERARNGFVLRSRPVETGASPFGLALRGGPPSGATWPYRLDGFPPGVSIAIAAASDDVRQPFVFSVPGTVKPAERADSGPRQRPAGFASLAVEELVLAAGVDATPLARPLAETGIVGRVTTGESHGLVLALGRDDGGVVRLRLPDFALV